MKRSFGVDRIATATILGVIGLQVALQSWRSPLFADDYYRAADVRLRGFKAIGALAWSISANLDGRLPDHWFMLALLGLPKPVFGLLNAVIVVGLLAGVTRLATGRASSSPSLLLWTAVLIWWTSPMYGQTMIWLTGACNYLWPTTFAVWLLIPYVDLLHAPSREPRLTWYQGAGLLLLGFLAGAGSETTGPGSLVALVAVLVLARRLPWWGIVGGAATLGGVILQLLEPGNRKRQAVDSRDGEGLIIPWLDRIIGWAKASLTTSFIAALTAITIALLLLLWRAREDGAVRRSAALLFGGLASFGTLLVANGFPERAMFGASTLILTAGLSAAWPARRHLQALRSALALALIASTVITCVSVLEATAETERLHVLNQRRIDDARSFGPQADAVVPAMRIDNKHVAGFALGDWPDYGVERWLGVHSVRTEG